MRGDEIDWDMIRGCKLEETGDPRGGGRRRTPNSKASTNGFQGASSVFIQSEVTLVARNAVPEIDVRFVPDFEVPPRNFLYAVARDQVAGKFGDERVPSLQAFRGRNVLFVPERMERVGV